MMFHLNCRSLSPHACSAPFAFNLMFPAPPFSGGLRSSLNTAPGERLNGTADTLYRTICLRGLGDGRAGSLGGKNEMVLAE